MEREYIVTAKTKEDLESLYHDLESEGGCECIPDRSIPCHLRRPISRNTHYMLTAEEAELIKKDPRVLDVDLTPEEKGFVIVPRLTRTSDFWNKSATNNEAHRPWAHYRCVNGATVANWGQNGSSQSITGSVLTTSTGKNVDVVIVDGCFDPEHPEFAVNDAGTGGSRVVQFNWYSLNPAVTGGAASTYHYTNIVTKTYGVTAGSGTANYVFTGSATGSGPTLSATRGDTLVFNVNTTASHPFFIKTTAATNGTNVGNGTTTGTITNNGASTGTITWNTAGVTPATYYYQCGNHGNMYGQIIITAGSYINGTTQQQDDNNHGCHVAGTVAGNRRGWAVDANIFNINPYGSAPSQISVTLLYDYIRAWHNSKAPNALTGKKNPTITNHSYGAVTSLPIQWSAITTVLYRGTLYNAPGGAGGGWSKSVLESYGILCDATQQQTVIEVPLWSTAVQSDIDDAVADGIIFIGAAGNDAFKADVPSGQDYNNYFVTGGNTAYYYHRGSYPVNNQNMISVGNIDANVIEQKSASSTCGPRVDIYAPGTNIVSSVHSNGGGVTDARSANYRITKYSGTSMASPQVCGVIACLSEQWPRMTQADVLEYLTKYGKKDNQLTSPTSSYTDFRSLQESANRYLFYTMERRVPNAVGQTLIGGVTTSQITEPRGIYKQRKDSGQVYPRPPIWKRKLI